jgi:hypothetical protein
MANTTICVTTSACYRGLALTVLALTLLGDTRAGLLTVAGYGTAQELAITAILVERRGARRVYCVAGAREWTPSVIAVAHAAINAHEAQAALD